MLTIEIKICQMRMEKENRIYENLLLSKKKNELFNLINHVEELENLSFNKYLSKYYENFLNS